MPEIQIKNFVFKPSLLPGIITCALLYLMISLGNWQLDRADYKAKLQSIIESRQNVDPVALNTLIKQHEDDWLYHPVFASGEFDTQHQIYYDNQVYNMVAGYNVFTPLKITETTGILINRGWLPVGRSRTKLPDIDLKTSGVINITGLLSLPPSKGIILSNTPNGYLQWPVVLQYIDIIEIQKMLGYKLLPMVIILNDSKQTALEIVPIKINMRSEKHTAYAFQWFALSLTLLIIYIVVNTKKLNKN